MAKLFCERLFSVRWMMHLDVYRNLVPTLWKGRSRPDLVGHDLHRNWVAVEAKGRSGPVAKKLMSEAKKQLQNLRRISGQFPSLKVATAVYFVEDDARVLMRDPDNFHDDAVDLDIECNRFVRDYYQPILDLFDVWPCIVEREQSDRFDKVSLANSGVVVGIDRAVVEQLRHRDDTDLARRLEAALPDAPQRLRPFEEGDDPRETDSVQPIDTHPHRSVGLDGILVELDSRWSPEQMRFEPKSRRSNG